MVYVRLVRMGFRRMAEYRLAHMINNLASVLFGFIYLSVWQAAAPATAPSGEYTAGLMVRYIALAQAGAWL